MLITIIRLKTIHSRDKTRNFFLPTQNNSRKWLPSTNMCCKVPILITIIRFKAISSRDKTRNVFLPAQNNSGKCVYVEYPF